MYNWLRLEDRAVAVVDWLISAGFIGLLAYTFGAF